MIIMTGILPVEILGQLTSMSTLLVFAIVALGILILRYKQPKANRPFKIPFGPIIPILAMLTCIAQMAALPGVTWIQLIIWVIVGLIIYGIYGYRKSILRHPSLKR
jgi:APA family basic amino acid/polyamine antiporter